MSKHGDPVLPVHLDFGYASAIAWLVVAIIGVLSFAQFKLLGRRS